MKACGNHKIKCGYRTYKKECKKPKEFKCKSILEKNKLK